MHPVPLDQSLARLSAALDGATEGDLTDPANVAYAADAIALCEDLMLTFRDVRQRIIDRLAVEMTADEIETPAGWLVRTNDPGKPKWRKEDARAAIRPAIVDEVATHPETGEVLPALKRAALRAIDAYEETFSIGDPKVAFMRKWGFDRDEFTEPGNPVTTVKLVKPGNEVTK